MQHAGELASTRQGSQSNSAPNINEQASASSSEGKLGSSDNQGSSIGTAKNDENGGGNIPQNRATGMLTLSQTFHQYKFISRVHYASTDKFDSTAFILGQESVATNGQETGLGKGSNKMSEQETSENGSRNTADNVEQEKGRSAGSSRKTPESTINNRQGEGSKPVTSTRKPNSEETNQMTNGNTDTYSTKPETNLGNTDGNTISTKPNENFSGQSTQTKPNQNIEKNTPVITDTTPQEPKIHPGREDNQIPKPEDGERSPVGKGSPVIEAPLQANVHKIAPETRLPGEFTSPYSEGNNLILKTKQNAIKRPFSKLLDAHQRDEIRHLVRAKT